MKTKKITVVFEVNSLMTADWLDETLCKMCHEDEKITVALDNSAKPDTIQLSKTGWEDWVVDVAIKPIAKKK